MRPSLTLLIAVIFMITPLTVAAVDKSEVRKRWHTPYDLYLSAREAYELKTSRPDQVTFIDVRTPAEVHYVGIADQIDANVPYQFDTNVWRTKSDGIHGYFRKKRNPDFETAVENLLKSRGLDKTSPVIIMCTSGSRAPLAAHALHKAGFKEVYTQVEGFEGIKAKSGEHKGKRLVAGWKHEGLPWSYDFVAAKMYFNFVPEKPEAKESGAK